MSEQVPDLMADLKASLHILQDPTFVASRKQQEASCSCGRWSWAAPAKVPASAAKAAHTIHQRLVRSSRS